MAEEPSTPAEASAAAEDTESDLTFSDDELSEEANGQGPEGVLEGWVPPPAEEPQVGAGWLGEALAATSPLSASDVGTLSALGIDANDGTAALRLLSSLVRALHRRGVLDLDELAAEVRAARPEGADAATAAVADAASEAAPQPSAE
jgi:hypothetical protein